MFGIARKENHSPRTVGGHCHSHRIRSIENRESRRSDIFDNHPLDCRELLGGLNSSHSQVITFTDVGDHGSIAKIESQSLPQDPPTGGLENSRLYLRIEQYRPGTLGTAAITRINTPVIQEDSIGAGHSYTQPL